MVMRRLAVLLLAPLVPLHAARADEQGQEVLAKVRAKYDSMVDARVKFSQSVKFEIARVEQKAAGVLFLKKRNKYRVELEDQTIVTNGETVWKYSAIQKQVLIDRFKIDDRAFSPELILTGAPSEYTPSVVGNERVGKVQTIVLKLTAGREDAFVQVLKLWVDQSTSLIRKVDYVDVSGKRTEYTVNDIEMNLGLDDSRFTYKVPEGADVVDLR